MSTVLASDRDGGVRLLTLNRPPANAINEDLLADLCTQLDAAARETMRVRAVVLTGAGKFFGAGFDLSAAAARRGGDRAHERPVPRRARGAALISQAHHRDGERPRHRRRVGDGAGLRLSPRRSTATTASGSTRSPSAPRFPRRRSRSSGCAWRTRAPASCCSARRCIRPARRCASAWSTSCSRPTSSRARCCAAPRAWAPSRATPTRTPRRRWSAEALARIAAETPQEAERATAVWISRREPRGARRATRQAGHEGVTLEGPRGQGSKGSSRRVDEPLDPWPLEP